MNRIFLCGRVTADPKTNDAHSVVKYSLAVDRPTVNGQKETDFINCVCFGKTGEFAEKYLHKGTKIIVEGKLQTGSYVNQEGQKVNTADVIVDRHEFVEPRNTENAMPDINKLVAIPVGVEDGELPFD